MSMYHTRQTVQKSTPLWFFIVAAIGLAMVVDFVDGYVDDDDRVEWSAE